MVGRMAQMAGVSGPSGGDAAYDRGMARYGRSAVKGTMHGQRPSIDRLRFGTYLAPNVLPVYEVVTETVGRRLGIETELVCGDVLREL
jgi:hypothetical protein